MISIRSKPPSLAQAYCFSSVRKRRIYSSLYDEASSLTRMSPRTRQLVAPNSSIILRISRSGKIYIFLPKQIKLECLKLSFTSGLRCSGLPSKCPGFQVIPDLAALLRSVSPHVLTLLRNALDRCLGRRYFTYQCSSPGGFDRADDVLALFWQVFWGDGNPKSRLEPPSIATLIVLSSRFCGQWFLRLWRYPQRSRLVVSPAVALFKSALLADRLPPPLFVCRVTIRS